MASVNQVDTRCNGYNHPCGSPERFLHLLHYYAETKFVSGGIHIFHVGCQNSARHLSHFYFLEVTNEISDTWVCRLSATYTFALAPKMILHPKEFDTCQKPDPLLTYIAGNI
jgi:hypothetical protein